MEAIPGDPFNSFVRWVDFIYGTPECFDPSFNGIVERSSNVEWDSVGTNSGSKLNVGRFDFHIIILTILFCKDANGTIVNAHKSDHF